MRKNSKSPEATESRFSKTHWGVKTWSALVEQVAPSTPAELFAEANKCHKHGTYRAVPILLWNALLSFLVIRLKPIIALNDLEEALYNSKQDDLKIVLTKERELVGLATQHKLLTSGDGEVCRQVRQARNNCAHLTSLNMWHVQDPKMLKDWLIRVGHILSVPRLPNEQAEILFRAPQRPAGCYDYIFNCMYYIIPTQSQANQFVKANLPSILGDIHAASLMNIVGKSPKVTITPAMVAGSFNLVILFKVLRDLGVHTNHLEQGMKTNLTGTALIALIDFPELMARSGFKDEAHKLLQQASDKELTEIVNTFVRAEKHIPGYKSKVRDAVRRLWSIASLYAPLPHDRAMLFVSQFPFDFPDQIVHLLKQANSRIDGNRILGALDPSTLSTTDLLNVLGASSINPNIFESLGLYTFLLKLAMFPVHSRPAEVWETAYRMATTYSQYDTDFKAKDLKGRLLDHCLRSTN